MIGYFGEEFTRRFTTAHEATPDNPSAREAMDLHNNEVGRRIAAEAAETPPSAWKSAASGRSRRVRFS